MEQSKVPAKILDIMRCIKYILINKGIWNAFIHNTMAGGRGIVYQHTCSQ